jgi:hypothetical protein
MTDVPAQAFREAAAKAQLAAARCRESKRYYEETLWNEQAVLLLAAAEQREQLDAVMYSDDQVITALRAERDQARTEIAQAVATIHATPLYWSQDALMDVLDILAPNDAHPSTL